MNDIEILLNQDKISKEQYDNYCLFAINSMGSEWLKYNIDQLFMASCEDINNHGMLANFEGIRSVFQSISYDIKIINDLLKNN